MGETFTVEAQRPRKGEVGWSQRHEPAPSGDNELIAMVRKELDEYHRSNQAFAGMEPDEVLSVISGITARLTYLRTLLLEAGSQRANKLRTSNLDPLMTNLELQFRISSRLMTGRQFDYEVTRGAPT